MTKYCIIGVMVNANLVVLNLHLDLDTYHDSTYFSSLSFYNKYDGTKIFGGNDSGSMVHAHTQPFHLYVHRHVQELCSASKVCACTRAFLMCARTRLAVYNFIDQAPMAWSVWPYQA